MAAKPPLLIIDDEAITATHFTPSLS